MVRRLLAGAVTCLAILQTTAAAAQVGHLPESSPYRDMRVKQALVFFGGVSWASTTALPPARRATASAYLLLLNVSTMTTLAP